jgi:hypothetical protein
METDLKTLMQMVFYNISGVGRFLFHLMGLLLKLNFFSRFSFYMQMLLQYTEIDFTLFCRLEIQ